MYAVPCTTRRRDFFLDASNYKGCRSMLVQRTGELLRKMWNTRNFKGQVRRRRDGGRRRAE